MTLAQLRHRHGSSQAQLAARIGMTQSDLSKAERRTDWKVSTLAAIARGLGMRAKIVFEDERGRGRRVIARGPRENGGR